MGNNNNNDIDEIKYTLNPLRAVDTNTNTNAIANKNTTTNLLANPSSSSSPLVTQQQQQQPEQDPFVSPSLLSTPITFPPGIVPNPNPNPLPPGLSTNTQNDSVNSVNGFHPGPSSSSFTSTLPKKFAWGKPNNFQVASGSIVKDFAQIQQEEIEARKNFTTPVEEGEPREKEEDYKKEEK